MMAHYETNRQVIHLSKAKRCLDKADHLSWTFEGLFNKFLSLMNFNLPTLVI